MDGCHVRAHGYEHDPGMAVSARVQEIKFRYITRTRSRTRTHTHITTTFRSSRRSKLVSTMNSCHIRACAHTHPHALSHAQASVAMTNNYVATHFPTEDKHQLPTQSDPRSVPVVYEKEQFADVAVALADKTNSDTKAIRRRLKSRKSRIFQRQDAIASWESLLVSMYDARGLGLEAY